MKKISKLITGTLIAGSTIFGVSSLTFHNKSNVVNNQLNQNILSMKNVNDGPTVKTLFLLLVVNM